MNAIVMRGGKMKTKHMDIKGNAEKYINREFCGIVVSNKDADPIKDECTEKTFTVSICFIWWKI